MARGSKRFYLQSKRKNKRINKDSAWKKNFDEFSQLLKTKGLFMRDVDGDGNCLFRAVADQLEGDEQFHEKYRVLAADQILANRNFYSMFVEDSVDIDQYINSMYENGTWAGEFELVALSEVLAIKFYIHRKDGTIFSVQSPNLKSSKKNLHLAYFIDHHYCSIRNIGDEKKSAAEDINIDLPSDHEDEGVKKEKISNIGSFWLECKIKIPF